jgi:HAD superfamily hydrolase (TIGR01450 family)
MIQDIITKYSALFIDAYGVLVDANGRLEGARHFVELLNREHHRYIIVTNDASQLHSNIAKRFQSLGLNIAEDNIVSAGSLLVDYFKQKELIGAKTRILGTQDSIAFAQTAGANIVGPDQSEAFDILVLADESGCRSLDSIDEIISELIKQIDRGHIPKLVLPNPDLMYPKSPNRYGIAAGGIALMIESVLALRFPEHEPLLFERLGKPHSWIFEAACEKAQTKDVLMIGDQLQTDILGAQEFGLDSLLLLTGLTPKPPQDTSKVCPTYVLPRLNL